MKIMRRFQRRIPKTLMIPISSIPITTKALMKRKETPENLVFLKQSNNTAVVYKNHSCIIYRNRSFSGCSYIIILPSGTWPIPASAYSPGLLLLNLKRDTSDFNS